MSERSRHVAVVGMAGRFPGAADVRAFGRNLEAGVESIATLDEEQLLGAGVPRGLLSDPSFVRRGALLSGVDLFDASLFGFTRREAELTDPQQRLFLETAWEALEDAGYGPRSASPPPRATGLFAGASLSKYLLFNALRYVDRVGSVESLLTLVGNDKDYLATRTAYELDLRGPAVGIQTACSTSLVAVHIACQSLLDGECDLALAGGVTVQVPQVTGYLHQPGGILSPDGRVRAFDAAAAGCLFGSGSGLVVLRRLEDALASGDAVRAVIAGSAIGNDGSGKAGFTAPSQDGEAEVIAAALAVAGFHPASIGLVEAHGTATALGDAIEVAALTEVFRARTAERGFCALGSVKTNVGHLEAASGIAGLIKAVLALERGVIPPSLHFSAPNPRISLPQGPFAVPTAARPWGRDRGPRRAGVSSFGIGGTNAHVVLEEAPDRPLASSAAPAGTGTLVLSARTEEGLRRTARRYAERLSELPQGDGLLADVCSTAALCRAPFERRVAFVGGSVAELREGLEAFVAGESHPGLLREATGEAGGRNDAAARFVRGESVDWHALLAGTARRRISLPGTSFERERFWIEEVPAGRAPARAELSERAVSDAGAAHPLLGTRVENAFDPGVRFESRLTAHSPSFLSGHRVAGEVVLPGAAFLEMAAAACRAAGGGPGILLEEVVFPQRLVLDPAEERTVQTLLDDDGRFRIASRGEGEWTLHAEGRVRSHPGLPAPEPIEGVRRRCPTVVDRSGFYGRLAAAGLVYGPPFDLLRELRSGAGEAVATMEMESACYVLHPALLDAALQALGAALPAPGPSGARIPFAAARVFLSGAPPAGLLDVHARFPSGSERGDVTILDSGGRLVAAVEGLSFRPIVLAVPAVAAREESFCEVAWQPVDAVPSAGSGLALPEALSRALGGTIAALEEELVASGVVRFREGLRALSLDLAAGVLADLGFSPAPGTEVEVGEVAGRLGVPPGRRRLLARLLEILAERGDLAPAGPGRYRAVRAPSPPGRDEREARVAALAEEFPACAGDLAFISRGASAAARVLRGEEDPVDVLFRGGPHAASLYRESPVYSALGRLVAGAVVAATSAASTVAPSRPLRILEVGAGTGATTAAVLPALAGRAFSYVFTDVSPAFLAPARSRFALFPSVRYEVLDVEREPGEQGFADASFDIVLAANVLHVARDLEGAVRNVARLLAPGGLLLALEGTAPQPWLDLTFGLTDGWWRFADHPLRPSYPLASRETWLDLLRSAGLRDSRALPPGEGGALRDQALLVAQAPSDFTRAWLLVGGPAALARELSSRASDRGDPVFVAASPEALGDLLPTIPPELPLGVLHLEALPGGAEVRRRGLAGLLDLVKTLLAERRPVPPRLVVVTRGAQPASPGEPVDVPAAALWGLRAVIALEHPELEPLSVDLDPQPAPPGEEAGALFAEALSRGGEDRVAYRSGTARRFVPRLVPLIPPEPAAPFRLEKPSGGSLADLAPSPGLRRPPAPGEVEIEIAASSLNFKDVLNATGLYPGECGPLGGECAGTVVAVGPGESGVAPGEAGLAPGDEVLAIAPGSLASHVTVPLARVARVPRGLSPAEAASLPIVFLTAIHALREVARLSRGERLLVHAATGGVGLAALQVARQAGAVIYATAGSEAKRRFLRGQGVEAVFDLRSPSFEEEVRRALGGAGLDVVLSSVPEGARSSLALLAPGGRFLELGRRGALTGAEAALLRPDVAYASIALDEVLASDPARAAALLAGLREEVERGSLSPLPLHLFGWGDVARAFALLAGAGHVGKVVVTRPPGRVRLRPEGTILVTGGTGGLGLAVAEWLVSRGARHLVLAGRRPLAALPEATRDAIAALGREGARVEVSEIDLAEPDRVAALVRSLAPSLRGIFHAAGLLDDGVLVQMTERRLDRVLGPKADAALVLHEETRRLPLDFFVLFSSAGSLLGSPGQGNHAAANAVLDALAHERRRLGLAALSIHWGAWRDVGAAAARAEGDLAGLALTPAEGIAALEFLVSRGPCGSPEIAVFPGGLRGLAARWIHGRRPPILADAEVPGPGRDAGAGGAGGEAHGTSRRAPGQRLVERLSRAPSAERRDLLALEVRRVAARILGVPPETLDPGLPLGDAGLDSLLAVELRNELARGLGTSLPATLLFDYPSVTELTRYLEREVPQLSALLGEGVGAPVGAPPEDEASADELAALLAGELAAIDEMKARGDA